MNSNPKLISAATTLTPEARWVGTGVDYRAALDLQRQYALERAAGRRDDTLMLLEHAAVYTAGRRSLSEHVLAMLPAPLVATDRGGLITYHGPGQLVGYPIIGLRERGLGPRAYVRALESALIDALADWGLAGHTEDEFTGVWTTQGKIAAIGVKISQGVTLHGFALNLTTDLSRYNPIVPCGITGRAVTSVQQVAGHAPSMTEATQGVMEALAARLGIDWRLADAPLNL